MTLAVGAEHIAIEMLGDRMTYGLLVDVANFQALTMRFGEIASEVASEEAALLALDNAFITFGLFPYYDLLQNDPIVYAALISSSVKAAAIIGEEGWRRAMVSAEELTDVFDGYANLSKDARNCLAGAVKLLIEGLGKRGELERVRSMEGLFLRLSTSK